MRPQGVPGVSCSLERRCEEEYADVEPAEKPRIASDRIRGRPALSSIRLRYIGLCRGVKRTLEDNDGLDATAVTNVLSSVKVPKESRKAEDRERYCTPAWLCADWVSSMKSNQGILGI